MATKKKLLQAAAGSASGSNYISGDYYPIFALKIVNDGGVGNGDLNASPGASTENWMRAALSLDASSSYSQSHDYSTSLSTIVSQAVTTGSSVDEAFASGGLDVNGYRIDYSNGSNTTINKTVQFDTSSDHNFYDDISNVSSNLYSQKTPTSVGSTSNVVANGSSRSSTNVLINASTDNNRIGNQNYWLSDGGDYCFMGVFSNLNSTNYGSNNDSLDRTVGSIDIAIGISDSDGAPSSGQSPRVGISRRNKAYKSLVTVNGYTVSSSHGGNTIQGVIILYGKVA
jgi:hypothetical protein